MDEKQEAEELAKPRKAPLTMTLDDVAYELNVSYQTAYLLARADKIGGMLKIGRQYRFDRGAFREWMKTRQTGNTQ